MQSVMKRCIVLLKRGYLYLQQCHTLHFESECTSRIAVCAVLHFVSIAEDDRSVYHFSDDDDSEHGSVVNDDTQPLLRQGWSSHSTCIHRQALSNGSPLFG
ncbi:hypothetical protein MTO96_000978 [Rhipicephalus appendiculatus]